MTLLAALDLENNSIEEFTLVGDASIVTTPVLTGTYALKVTNAFAGSFIYYSPIPAATLTTDTMYMHCIWRTQNTTVTRPVMFIYDTDTANPCAELLIVGNKLEVHVYTDTARTGDESDTGSTVISANTNYRLELQYIVSNGNSRGFVEVKLDGTTEASKEHSTDTGYDQMDRLGWGKGRFIAFGGGNDQFFSDMWANDNSTSENSGFPGNLTFVRARPTSDGFHDLWRGVTDDTDHYKNVDEVDVSDSDFVVADANSTGNEKQSFGVATISTGKTIRAIKANIRRKSLGATSTTNSNLIRESGTDLGRDVDTIGEDITAFEYSPVTTTAGDFGPQYWDTLPSSGGKLTNAAVSALEIGGFSKKDTSTADTLVPTSDTTQQWTRSTGADNFALIDEGTSTPNDSDYIESATSGDEDQYLIATPIDREAFLNATPKIRLFVRAKIQSGSASSIEGAIKIGGTFYTSDSSVSVSGGTFTLYILGWALDPRDSGTWFSSDAPDFQGFSLKHLDSNGTVRISEAELNVNFQPTLRISQLSIMAVHDDTTEVLDPIPLQSLLNVDQAVKRSNFF